MTRVKSERIDLTIKDSYQIQRLVITRISAIEIRDVAERNVTKGNKGEQVRNLK